MAITIDLAPCLCFHVPAVIVVWQKARGGTLSQRALINLTVLEFKTQIRLEYLILIERIDTDVAEAPGAECVVDLPGIGVGEVEDYGISQHVPGSHSHALQVQLAVEDI